MAAMVCERRGGVFLWQSHSSLSSRHITPTHSCTSDTSHCASGYQKIEICESTMHCIYRSPRNQVLLYNCV